TLKERKTGEEKFMLKVTL
ncbi:uncharacterized, partial [Tachysurus ichikawai]